MSSSPSDSPHRPPGDRRALEDLAAALPPLVRLVTSTWTYPGWLGLVYAPPYPTEHVASALLKRYAEHPLFRTVGIDHSFYRPLDSATLAEYAAALPTGFQCVTKARQRITAPVLEAGDPHAAHYEPNPDFLSHACFADEIVAPLVEHFADHLGPIVLEFESLARAPWLSPERFIELLDQFLDRVPETARYAVEVRNPALLTPTYFAVLRAHGVAHCFNAWTFMPPIGEQLALPDSVTADFVVCRALLTPGRQYRTAVKEFEPYDRIRRPAPATRADLVRMIEHAVALRVPLYVLVNNRLEGCAPATVRAVAEGWAERHAAARQRSAGE